MEWDEEEVYEQIVNDLEELKQERYHPTIKERRKTIREKIDITIWLGGPGPQSDLYIIRNMIRDLLENEGFEVVFSEELPDRSDLAGKELEEIEAMSDIVIILAVSTGSSAEAIEFAQHHHLKKKIYVYLPEEYNDGYVYRSLDHKRLIDDRATFSLENLKENDPELNLFKNLIIKTSDKRADIYRDEMNTYE